MAVIATTPTTIHSEVPTPPILDDVGRRNSPKYPRSTPGTAANGQSRAPSSCSQSTNALVTAAAQSTISSSNGSWIPERSGTWISA
jgi:hypothetical protein